MGEKVDAPPANSRDDLCRRKAAMQCFEQRSRDEQIAKIVTAQDEDAANFAQFADVGEEVSKSC